MAITPHVLCGHCGHVFASEAGLEDEVTCPACGHTAPPGGVMRPTGFPTLEVFRRNVEAARSRRQPDA